MFMPGPEGNFASSGKAQESKVEELEAGEAKEDGFRDGM